jgi:hypothetical protein
MISNRKEERDGFSTMLNVLDEFRPHGMVAFLTTNPLSSFDEERVLRVVDVMVELCRKLIKSQALEHFASGSLRS